MKLGSEGFYWGSGRVGWFLLGCWAQREQGKLLWSARLKCKQSPRLHTTSEGIRALLLLLLLFGTHCLLSPACMWARNSFIASIAARAGAVTTHLLVQVFGDALDAVPQPWVFQLYVFVWFWHLYMIVVCQGDRGWEEGCSPCHAASLLTGIMFCGCGNLEICTALGEQGGKWRSWK